MLYLVIFISVFIILVIFILNSRSKIVVEYNRVHGYNSLYLTFYLIYEIIKLRYKVPLEEIQSDGLRLVRIKKKDKEKESEKQEKKDKKEKKKEEGLSLSDIYEKIKSAKCFYALNRKYIRDITDYLRKKLTVQELDLKVRAGTGDAFYTGVLSGLMWSITGVIISFICSNFCVMKKCIDIQPNFSKKEMKIHFHCILKTKLVHIIVVRIKFYKFLKKKRNYKAKKVN